MNASAKLFFTVFFVMNAVFFILHAYAESYKRSECMKVRKSGPSLNGYLQEYRGGLSNKERMADIKKILDRNACQKARKSGTVGVWKKYLKKYPKGECAKVWALIESGSFQMGAPDDEAERDVDEGPVHEVTISHSFLLKKTEVTQGELSSLMGKDSNHSHFSNCGDDCPVEAINWWESLAYCNALSRSEGLEECYELSGCVIKKSWKVMYCDSVKFSGLGCKGYRLPTEAEWEYAARAGTTGPYYADNLDDIAWYYGNSDNKTHSVGQKSPNAWGLFDMLGNVHEWTWDSYEKDYYTYSPKTDPLVDKAGSSRVARGGAWNQYASRCRLAYRQGNGPDIRDYGFGLRPARSLEY